MRVLWAMGHKVTVAIGCYKSKLRLRQHSPDFVELESTDPVLGIGLSATLMCW
jgi:hypothetical protein